MDLMTIWNMALGRIGQSQPVQTPTEQSNQAIQCNIFWPSVAYRVLTAFPWGFANKYETLQPVGNPPDGWRFAYRYPSDCVKIRAIARTVQQLSDPRINAEIAEMGQLNNAPFQVVTDIDNSAKLILCNMPQAVIRYTADVTALLNIWDADAASAAAWLLASEIAGPLASKPEYAKMAGEAYKMAILEAGALALNENQVRPPQSSSIVEAMS